MTNDLDSSNTPLMMRLVEVFLRGDVAILLVIISLLLGAASLALTPREEEPQIVVPMADVFVTAPGLSAEEVERQVADRLEKLLYQIDGVEFVDSMSQAGRSVVTVRFYVGEDREDSLVKIYNKINSSTDMIPPTVDSWVVKPIEVDDVPIVIATLWPDEMERYGDHELRRVAEEVQHELQAIPNTNRVQVVGGRPRRIRVNLDAQRLAAHKTSPLQVAQALQVSNVSVRNGEFEQQDRQFIVESGTFIRGVADLQEIVVNVAGGRPVYLKNVATVRDGPAEADSYTWIGFGPAESKNRENDELYPAVHISIAKKKGTNAVWVADAVEERLNKLSKTHFPSGVHFRITRHFVRMVDTCRHHVAVGWGNDVAGLSTRSGENAPLRQQGRVSGCHRHAGRRIATLRRSKLARSSNVRGCRRVALRLGQYRQVIASTGPAKANGTSRSMCSVIWDWHLQRLCSASLSS